MKVAIHADPALHEIPGGIGVYVRRLVDALLDSEDGHSYSLILSRTAEPPPRWREAELIRPVLPVGQLYGAWNFTGRPRIKDEADVVHATGLAIPPLPGKLVATIHDLGLETMPEVVPSMWRRIYLKGLQIALDRAAVLCAVSESTKAELIERHSVEPDRIVVTPEAANITPDNATDDRIFERLMIDGPFILCVGTIEPRKNQIRLIKAYSESRSELGDLKLVIAGTPGWAQDRVTDAIDVLKVGHKVFLTGKVTNSELASLYAKATAFAFPSVYEGFGLPLLEAMSFGIPSLAGRCPALAEVAGEAALLVDPKEVSEIAKALVSIATDSESRDRLAVAGRKRAAQFSWAETANATRRAYEKAVAG